jgi:hypothetical protein
MNSTQINWIFHNATTSPSAGNELNIFAYMQTANIEISGTGTATVYFEGKATDNGNYYPIAAVNLATLNVETTTTSIGSLYQVDLTGLYKLRVRLDNVVGSINVSAKVVD